jgi:23S rRNA (cytidine2498-2'-O)-methyltransferase
VSDSPFMFVTCQVGAEPAVKAEVAAQWPESRFAFSRPGFLTFKLPADLATTTTPTLRSVFARTVGWSLGPVKGDTPEARAAAVWQLVSEKAADRQFDRLHVWQRDTTAAGHRGFEPGITPAATAALQLLIELQPSKPEPTDWTALTRRGDRVLDCILIDDTTWWVGHHRSWTRPQGWPGGFWPGPAPAEIVSRAYLKMAEALDWSGMALQAGQTAAEIGCAPGGASQALLDRGLRVVGIDPADVDTRVLANPNFTHIRKRGVEVKRRQFRSVQWLMADMNVPPEITLTTLEGIVTFADLHVRGVIANLKLADWKLAADVPQYLTQIRGWGFDHVSARQLGHNRQEICVAAWKESARRQNIGNSPRRHGDTEEANDQ